MARSYSQRLSQRETRELLMSQRQGRRKTPPLSFPPSGRSSVLLHLLTSSIFPLSLSSPLWFFLVFPGWMQLICDPGILPLLFHDSGDITTIFTSSGARLKPEFFFPFSPVSLPSSQQTSPFVIYCPSFGFFCSCSCNAALVHESLLALWLRYEGSESPF